MTTPQAPAFAYPWVRPLMRWGTPCLILMQGSLVQGWIRHQPGRTPVPWWAEHPGLSALAWTGVLTALWIGTLVYMRWWKSRALSMPRSLYRRWHRWGLWIGLPMGLLVGGLGSRLPHWLNLPHEAFPLLFTSLTAVTMFPFMELLQETEAQARTWRELALQARLAPHFLFNALSTLKGQIRQDPQEAEATADALARCFREVMALSAEREIPLRRELAFVEAYLGVEQARLGARLEVDLDIAEEAEECPLPPLALQILVENAVKHGIATRREGGRIRIRAWVETRDLWLSVDDPGDGTGAPDGLGQSLDLLRRRLADPADLHLGALPEGGHRALLRLRQP